MLKKILFIFFLFNSVVFAENIDFSEIAKQIRNNLPEKFETYYAENESYFKFGHFIAKNYEINTGVKNLYDKIISGMKTNNRISHINAVYYGIFEYLIIEDFFYKSNIYTLISGNNFTCLFTGLETYNKFQDFNVKKSDYETFIKKYTTTYDKKFNYNNFTQKYLCNFNDLILNLHTSILAKSGIIENYIFLKSNSSDFYPSDKIKLKISTDYSVDYEGKVFAIEDNSVFYFYNGSEFKNDFTYLPSNHNDVIMEFALPEFPEYKSFVTYAGVEPFANELEVSSVNIKIKDPFNVSSSEIDFSPYVLNVYDDYSLIGSKILQPLDFIFVGGLPDDPYTQEDESAIGRTIPGKYSHLVIYFGRLSDGTPLAAEMTTTLEKKEYSLRMIKSPENINKVFDSSSYDLPLVTVNIYKYKDVDAKRLNEEDLSKLLIYKDKIYQRVISDIYDSFPYQYQFDWSGDLSDKNIYLVDDELEGGAACTDYWLMTFEELAGVCINGARMNDEDLIYYFNNDPVGSTVNIPGSFNPFTFDVYVKNLINFLGFKVVNPEPHIFSCDGSKETGIAVPTKLYLSEQMKNIKFINTDQIDN